MCFLLFFFRAEELPKSSQLYWWNMKILPKDFYEGQKYQQKYCMFLIFFKILPYMLLTILQ